MGVDLERIVKRVRPKVFHVLPVADDAVIHRVAELEHGTEFGGILTDHDILFLFSFLRTYKRCHSKSGYFDLNIADLLLSTEDGATDDGREDGSWEIGAGETALDELECTK